MKFNPLQVENGNDLARAMCLPRYNLSITSYYYFQTKPQHKVSWRHPRSKHFHQLDVILRSHLSKDWNTDNSLVRCNFRPQLRKLYRAKKQAYTRVNVSKMFQPDLLRQFAVTIEKELGDSQPSCRLGREK